MRNRILPLLLVLLLTACTAAGAPATAVPTPTPSVPPPAPTSTAVPVPVSGLTSVSMIDARTGWAWATRPDSSFQLLRTADGGLTWRDVTPANLPIVSSGSFFLDGQTAWVQLYDANSNANGLAATADGGRTWATVDASLPFVNAGLTFSDDRNGWAESADVGAGNAFINLYATADGGASWTQLALQGPPSQTAASTPATIHLCNICGDQLYYDPQHLVLTYGDLASEAGGAVRLSVSTDLGKTWKDLRLPLPAGPYASDLIAPHAPIFFTPQDALLPVQMTRNTASSSDSDLALYATHDGGLTWSGLPTVLENASPFDLASFVTPLDGFARCGNDLCSTNDGGLTWQTLSTGLNFDSSTSSTYVFQFQFVNPTTGWAITTDGTTSVLWVTTSNGASWAKLAPVLAP